MRFALFFDKFCIDPASWNIANIVWLSYQFTKYRVIWCGPKKRYRWGVVMTIVIVMMMMIKMMTIFALRWAPAAKTLCRDLTSSLVFPQPEEVVRIVPTSTAIRYFPRFHDDEKYPAHHRIAIQQTYRNQGWLMIVVLDFFVKPKRRAGSWTTRWESLSWFWLIANSKSWKSEKNMIISNCYSLRVTSWKSWSSDSEGNWIDHQLAKLACPMLIIIIIMTFTDGHVAVHWRGGWYCPCSSSS